MRTTSKTLRAAAPLAAMLVLIAALVIPAVASARPLPSGSAIDEYSEGVPQANGQSPSTESGNGAIPPGTDSGLQAKGKAGAAAAAAAKITAPPKAGGADDSGSGGMGFLLWLLLGASLLTAVAIFLRRRQNTASA
jgi:hypothetical protein